MIEIIQNFGIRPKFSYKYARFRRCGQCTTWTWLCPTNIEMISDFTISAGLARGVRSSYMGPAATVLGHRMSCRIRYRLPSFQVVFFWSSEQCPILKICDNEITDLESHRKQKAIYVFLMNAKFQPKTQDQVGYFVSYHLDNGVYCRTARHRWLSVQSWVLGCPWYGCSLVPWGTSDVQKLSTVPWCQLCWEGFVSIVGIAKKRSMSLFLGMKAKEDSDYIILIWV